MIKKYYAKSKLPNGHQLTVKEHLQAVAELAGQYGSEFERGEETRMAGLFHDFGKYSDIFADVLEGKRTNIDHAMYGAAFLHYLKNNKSTYRPIIEAINGHHTGLVAFDELESVLDSNFREGTEISLNNNKTAAIAGIENYQNTADNFKHDFPDFKFPKLRKFIAQNQESAIYAGDRTIRF